MVREVGKYRQRYDKHGGIFKKVMGEGKGGANIGKLSGRYLVNIGTSEKMSELFNCSNTTKPACSQQIEPCQG